MHNYIFLIEKYTEFSDNILLFNQAADCFPSVWLVSYKNVPN